MVVAAAVLLAPVAVSSSASATAATDGGPSLTHLVHFGSGLGSGSTIGPDGALYVTDGKRAAPACESAPGAVNFSPWSASLGGARGWRPMFSATGGSVSRYALTVGFGCVRAQVFSAESERPPAL